VFEARDLSDAYTTLSGYFLDLELGIIPNEAGIVDGVEVIEIKEADNV